jgi:hypothetical protein
MKSRNYLILILASLLLGITLSAQAQNRISGFVRDKQSGENLIGANIVVEGETGGTSTDNSGYFSIMAKIPCVLKISFVGFKQADLALGTARDTLIHIGLEPGKEIEAIVIKGIRKPINNISTLRISELRQLPSLGGKPDVLKSMQLLPGIQTQNEGSSLLLVRGGDPGQNLYLFDNIPVIYVNHLGGFTSVFNPDIINSIDVYKGGFPARYGGRVSSVVDIAQREGDRTKLRGSLSLGVTDLSFTVEGPTKLRNTSFILTGRKTLIDPLMAAVTRLIDMNGLVVAYGFHDLNGKFTWKPDERNSFNLNLYQGDDYLNFWSKQKSERRTGDLLEMKTEIVTEKSHLKNVWGNWLASARWNHVITPRVFMTNTLSYTRYRLNLFQNYSMTDSVRHPIFERNYLSSVGDLSLRTNFKIQVLKWWSVETGVQASYLNHTPNSYYQSTLEFQPSVVRLGAIEPAVYLDNKFSSGSWFEANLGLRSVAYISKGYSATSFEPRLRIGLTFAQEQQIHASYQRVTQNEQLLFTSGSIMNNEVWVPAGAGIEPAWSDQFTLGWNGSFHQGQIAAEITAYYKTLTNLATYREGYSSLMGDPDWRSKVVTGGSGRSTGVEILLKKQYGDWTGFASYAYSHTTRQFPQINKGQEFVFDFDRPHTASLNINHRFNEKWSASLTWVYQTGLPYTPVLGRQLTQSTEPDENGNFKYYEVLLYGDRNSSRMKDYHRLDAGVTLNTLTRHNRKATWTFSVYNLYNRHNPYFYYINTDNKGGFEKPEYLAEFKPMYLYQMSFFPIIPSVSYKLYFDGTATKGPMRFTGEKFRKWLYQEK